ncbi:MAG TPA: nitrilase-related carbon-nitrogen hydrolase [Candidatus Saccharimonadales bacterium]|nr:nitrilase-related carbon-nitrogen hydrolase [Candidatus Saccharimonadales bacterium]
MFPLLNTAAPNGFRGRLTLPSAFIWSFVAVSAFHLAYFVPRLSWMIVVYLFCLTSLIRLASSRQAFYFGFGVGFMAFAPHLLCFYTIFGLAAVPLWAILAFWNGIFLLMAWLVAARFGMRAGLLLIPVLWTGLEYFRSELYYLRFAWLTPGFALSPQLPGFPMHLLGVYGTGFLLVVLVCGVLLAIERRMLIYGGALLALGGLAALAPRGAEAPQGSKSHELRVAGIQMEFPVENEIPPRLNDFIKNYPDAELLVMSEYSLDGPVPDQILKWCKDNRRYLLIGGKQPVSATEFRNTAFVVGPEGKIVFEQAKSVPIQFFKDGLPAQEQKVWDSPWGKIGICICYDFSYTRVVDRLIRMGAQALIVPTMDVVEWGRQQHELHARVAVVRAAEYRVPVFRLASSGISQALDSHGRVLEKTKFADEWATIAQDMELGEVGSLPLDRWLAPGCVAATIGVMLMLGFSTLKLWRAKLKTGRAISDVEVVA